VPPENCSIQYQGNSRKMLYQTTKHLQQPDPVVLLIPHLRLPYQMQPHLPNACRITFRKMKFIENGVLLLASS